MAKRRPTNARQAKLAAIRAQQARARQRLMVSLGAIGVVVVIAIALVVVKVASGSGGSGAATTAAQSSVVKGVSSVPASVYNQIGAGSVVSAPAALTSTALTSGGKPRVLYVGAEYCPYCAAERWAFVAALSRFGSFSNLGQTTSSSRDVYPSTATLSFHGATYTSKYLSFTGYETQSNQIQGNSYAQLDTLAGSDLKLFQTYDAPPYVAKSSEGAIPFIDLGGAYVIHGAEYDPGLLKGMTHSQIATAMHDPSSKVAAGVDGTANTVTATLCKLTKDQPATVCSSSGVTTAAAKLGSS